MTFEPSQAVITMGVHPGLIATLKTFSPKGTKVLLQTPTYNGFYGDLTASWTEKEEVQLKKNADGTFAMDFEAFEKQISVDTNSFILCNPQNTTGNCWSAEDLLRIGEICLKHRVVVLADEIYSEILYEGTHDSILHHEGMASQTILLDGQVAGNIGSWPQDGVRLVGYWIGKEYWGKGVATRALAAFLHLVNERPLHAHVARHNIGSIRVLEKCGFSLDRVDGKDLAELVLVLH